jgi:hypothetical protein
VLDDTAATEELILVDRNKGEFSEQLRKLGVLAAGSGVKGVVAILRITHLILTNVSTHRSAFPAHQSSPKLNDSGRQDCPQGGCL